MTELFLIAHKVRGEPALDVAQQMKACKRSFSVFRRRINDSSARACDVGARNTGAVVLLLGSARDRAEGEEMRIGPRAATFERWTAEDEALLQTMLDAKTDLHLIARKLKRSRPAIHKRINVLRKKRELEVEI
jgi:hypothetical protein